MTSAARKPTSFSDLAQRDPLRPLRDIQPMPVDRHVIAICEPREMRYRPKRWPAEFSSCGSMSASATSASLIVQPIQRSSK